VVGVGARAGRGGLPAGKIVALDAAAHALLLGLDWRRMLDAPEDEVEVLVTQAVLQRALDLQHERDRRLATMVANGVNGARSVDGRRSSATSTSTA
jgi:hypothetical protein